MVEQVAGALAKQLVSQRLVFLAAAKQPRHRQQLDGRQGDQVIVPDERVELGGIQALDVLVVDREVQHREEVALLGVLVDLGPLALREHVLEIERVPTESLLERRRLLGGRCIEMNPGQPVGRELGDARLRACEDFPVARAGPRSLDPRQAWHRY